jgi:serine phosphatase RsbU (regulator of sigma subunit)
MGDVIRPGTPFQDILRAAAARDLIAAARGRQAEWLAERLERHRQPDGAIVLNDTAGRWIRVSERKTEDGCTVAVHADITELKHREEALVAEQRRTAAASRQVMESIRYASRIQSAILPAPETLAAAVPEHFVIWEPRDIVGGDVYWCSPVEGGHVLLVGDCTGHGVPGAFMTLIATGVLDDVAREMPGSNPARMLARVHVRLRAVLGKDRGPAGFADDGLEAGLCYIPFRRDLLVFAGAHLSLWRARDGAVREIKGDRPMLGFQHDPDDIAFTNKPLDVRRGECFYLATDGLTDQIGGPRRRAFGKRRLAGFAETYHRRPMNQQGSILRSLFVDHQGDEVRRDDVAVLGFAPLGLGPGRPAA